MLVDRHSNSLVIYDDNHNILCKLNGEVSIFSVYCISGEKNLVATQNNGNECIIIWDMKTGSPIYNLLNEDFTFCMSFSPVNYELISGNYEGVLKVWDLEKKTLKTVKKMSDDFVELITFSNKGNVFAVVVANNVIKVINSYTFDEIYSIGENFRIYGIYFSKNDEYFGASSWDSYVSIYDINGKPIQKLVDHENQFTNIKFSNCSRYVASKHYNDMVKIWEIGYEPYIFSHTNKKFSKFSSYDWKIRRIRLDSETKKVVEKLLNRFPDDIKEMIYGLVIKRERLYVNSTPIFCI